QVIGLLRDEKHYGLDREMKASVFHPLAPTMLTVNPNDGRSLREISIVLRGSIDLGALTGPAREVARQLDPDAPIYDVSTMTERLDRSLWTRRAYSWLFGAFATVAILLAVAGVYGILSYSVSQRTQEIGIRLALGARPAQVLTQVLRDGMVLVSIGVAAGLAGALSGAELLRTLLFGVSSREPVIYAAVAVVVIAVGLLANLAPARRA